MCITALAASTNYQVIEGWGGAEETQRKITGDKVTVRKTLEPLRGAEARSLPTRKLTLSCLLAFTLGPGRVLGAERPPTRLGLCVCGYTHNPREPRAF